MHPSPRLKWAERMLDEHFFPQSAKINVKANLWYRADEGRRGEGPKPDPN